MQVTEVRIKLTGESDDRLLAFCSITLDNCFVVRDLKIIGGSSGPFVAMPSRKLTGHCPRCHAKNHLRSNYCAQCGADLRRERTFLPRENARLYADIAHPINTECRELIQSRVIEEFEKEKELSSLPGYRSRYDDEYDHFEESKANRTTSVDPGQRSTQPDSEPSETKSAPMDGQTASQLGAPIPEGGDRTSRSDSSSTKRLQGPHQSPQQSEKSSKSDESDDQFGVGIL